MEALGEFSRERELVQRLQGTFKAPREEIAGRIDELFDTIRTLEKTVASLRQQGLGSTVESLVSQASALGSLTAVVSVAEGVADADDLRHVAQSVLQRMSGDNAVAVIGTVIDGRGTVIVAASSDAVDAGVHAGNLVKQASELMGGGGGGKPQMAQGGGPEGASMAEALELVRSQLAAV